jgi:hypothetical protein
MYAETVMLPVVSYGCETWSVTLGEEHRLRMYEDKVMRIFGPKWEKVTRGCRKLLTEEHYNCTLCELLLLLGLSRLGG